MTRLGLFFAKFQLGGCNSLWFVDLNAWCYTRPVSCLLNSCEFHFLWLHINKINKFCFLINNGGVPGYYGHIDKMAI